MSNNVDVFQELLNLRNSGHITLLFQTGFISSKLINSIDITLEYDVLRKRNIKKMEARKMIATRFDIDIATVYRILKRVQYEDWSASSDKRR